MSEPSSRLTLTRLGPPTIGEPPSMRRNVANSTKRADDASLKVTVECAGVARASWRQFSRTTAIEDRDRATGSQTLIARIGRVRKRRTARLVIGQQRQKQIRRRRAHAVEMRERAFRMAEKAQHRHHSIDRVLQRLRWCDIAGSKSLAQRQ